METTTLRLPDLADLATCYASDPRTRRVGDALADVWGDLALGGADALDGLPVGPFVVAVVDPSGRFGLDAGHAYPCDAWDSAADYVDRYVGGAGPVGEEVADAVQRARDGKPVEVAGYAVAVLDLRAR